MNKKHVKVGVAVASVTAVTGAALPQMVSAATPATSTTGAAKPGVDLSTPEAARAYFQSIGIAPTRVQQFAAGVGLDANGYYAAVAKAWTNKTPGAAPIEFANGKVTYNNTVSKSGAVKFTKTRTRTQTGTTVSGRCTFDALAIDDSFGSNILSEVTSLDPAACVRTVFDGVYDPAATTSTKAATTDAVAATDVMAAAASGPSFLPCGSLTKAPTLYQPNVSAVDGEHRKYYKQAFVDPVCISITSGTLNIRWKNAVNSSTDVTILTGSAANVYYYTQLGENWPSSKKQVALVPAPDASQTRYGEGTAYLGHNRVETDFPEHLALAAAMMGSAPLVVALAACKFDLSDTFFGSNQWIYPQRNGGWRARGDGDVFGGCSSLVHETVWHGSGTYAR